MLDVCYTYFMKLALTYDNLKNALEEVSSLRELLGKLGYSVGGANAKTIKAKLKEYDLEISKISKARTLFSLEEILVENSPYQSTRHLKDKLVKLGLIKYSCVLCSNDGTWLGEAITLQLDHINGNNTDNRLENLRILCPNCHSQTSTWGGRNIER